MTQRRILLSSGVTAVCLAVGGCHALFGCSLDSRLGTIESKVGKIETRVATVESGRDTKINEPVTGWILASGFASIPVSFLLYMIAHRFKTFRGLKDVVRGVAAKKKA